MRRSWIAVVIVVGALLGLAIAGVPHRHHDAPLRLVSSPANSTSKGIPTTVPVDTTAATGPTMATSAPHTPRAVTVIVVQAGGNGDSLAITAKINAAGYATVKPAKDTTDHVTGTSVEYMPGYSGDAQPIANAAGYPGAAIQPVASTFVGAGLDDNANVVVVLGG